MTDQQKRAAFAHANFNRAIPQSGRIRKFLRDVLGCAIITAIIYGGMFAPAILAWWNS